LALNGVCGPSGSGKSTLILDTLVPALQGEQPAGRWSKFEIDGTPRCVVIDATPIGRSPASTPATYTGLLEPIRELFARTPDARMKGFGPSHFSFNSPKGRCPACEGKGATLVEMQFLADLWLECEECGGKRFAPEVLEVRYRGKNVADVLELSVDAALEFLEAHPRAVSILKTLKEVGLGYMSLGQGSTTLSGGEAQRVKLAGELFSASSARRRVVLTSLSTGLHAFGRRAPRGGARAPGRRRPRCDHDRAPHRAAAICDESGRSWPRRRRSRRSRDRARHAGSSRATRARSPGRSCARRSQRAPAEAHLPRSRAEALR
jgi:excinuclease UvrABC ATPase subunit